MAFWTYMLHCRGGGFYVGHTDNLERRIGQHESGTLPGFTSDRLPVKLVWSEYFGTRLEALENERKLKGWSRAKKMALIRGDWGSVVRLARNRQQEKDEASTSSAQTELGGGDAKIELTLVVARADNGVIGRDGALPWRIPADLKRFKALTMGAPMIMGRKTFESLPGLLPGRRHIVLTRDREWREEGAEVVHDVEEALNAAGERASVIGGAEIYRLFLPLVDRIELTEVHIEAEGDTMLDGFGTDWRETARDDHDGSPAYSFVTLERAR